MGKMPMPHYGATAQTAPSDSACRGQVIGYNHLMYPATIVGREAVRNVDGAVM